MMSIKSFLVAGVAVFCAAQTGGCSGNSGTDEASQQKKSKMVKSKTNQKKEVTEEVKLEENEEKVDEVQESKEEQIVIIDDLVKHTDTVKQEEAQVDEDLQQQGLVQSQKQLDESSVVNEQLSKVQEDQQSQPPKKN